jgi:hypothetical protein
MFTPVRGLNLSLIPIMPTSDVILEHARKTRANAIVSVPSFLEAWALSSEAVEYLKSYVFVVRVFLLIRIFICDKPAQSV